ncbi:hypothetical protein LBC_15220 [Campylobacter sp. 19-13652]|nr:hypothetical protein LBC_15220 [Campylobacter sp. 19-13652]
MEVTRVCVRLFDRITNSANARGGELGVQDMWRIPSAFLAMMGRFFTKMQECIKAMTT